MKIFRGLILLGLLMSVPTQADDSFFIPKDRIDVITPLICVASKADPTQWITVNHDTTALSIRITTGDINETFAFSGATIDDHTTRGTHCNPATANLCLETETDGCFFLHLHDEVLDGAVKYWTILIDDGQSVLMDTKVHMMTELMEPADVESEVNDALTAFGGGVATDANVDANEDKIDILDLNVDQVEVAVITNAAGVDIAADIAAIESQTDDIGVAGAGLTAIDLPNQTMDITGNLSGSVGSVTGDTPQTGDNFARLGAPAGASVSVDIAANQTDLDSLTDGGVLVATTIATLSTQVSFTLTDGSADDNAYNRKVAIIIDVSTATQIAVGKVLDYVGSTKTVTLSFDPNVFMMAATDKIVILSSEF